MQMTKARVLLVAAIAGFAMFVTAAAYLMGGVRDATSPALLIAGSLAVMYVALHGLLRTPCASAIKRVRNQLVFAFCGVLMLPAVALLFRCLGGHAQAVRFLELWLSVAAFALLNIGGWIIVIHTIGLILSVGRRLSRRRRQIVYFVFFSLPVFAASFVTECALLDRVIYSVAADILVVILLDFRWRKYPDVEEQSQYDVLARRIARLLGGDVS